MNYIVYHDMEEFYTIKELCFLFGISKERLKAGSERYSVRPEKIEGKYGLTKVLARRLHNYMYKEYLDNRNTARNEDPWND
jgi:hypothetical protein